MIITKNRIGDVTILSDPSPICNFLSLLLIAPLPPLMSFLNDPLVFYRDSRHTTLFQRLEDVLYVLKQTTCDYWEITVLKNDVKVTKKHLRLGHFSKLQLKLVGLQPY